MMVGVVPTILVGRLGKEYTAAVGMVNNLVNFFQTVFTGLAMGSTIVIARVIGESGMQKAKNVLVQSIILGILVGVSISIFGMLFSKIIITTFFGSADKEVLRLVRIYYRVILFRTLWINDWYLLRRAIMYILRVRKGRWKYLKV